MNFIKKDTNKTYEEFKSAIEIALSGFNKGSVIEKKEVGTVRDIFIEKALERKLVRKSDSVTKEV